MLGRRNVRLTTGKKLDAGGFQDIDGFKLEDILQFRTLVLGRAPTAGRPPSSYNRVWRGDYYEAWQRPGRSAGRVREHLPFGDIFAPASVPKCTTLRKFARNAGRKGGQISRGGRGRLVEPSAQTESQPAPSDMPAGAGPHEGSQ